MRNGIKNKKKIVICLDQMIMGGVEKIAMILFPQLSKKFDLSIILGQKIIDPFFLNFFQSKNIPIYYFNEKPKKFWKKILWKIFKRKKHKNEIHSLLSLADLIIDFKNFTFCQKLRAYPQIRKLVIFHGSFPTFLLWKCENSLKDYDQIICLTKNFKRDFIKKFKGNKIIHIYNPLDKDIYNLSGASSNYSGKYFIAVQRLDKSDKDVLTIVRAFKDFNKRHPDYKLLIVGDGPNKSEIESEVDNDNIILTGQINNPMPLIKNAEALILSSTKEIGEGLPTVLLEAQALRTLAISSDVESGPCEILMDGKAGILFKQGDSKQLTQILNDLADKKVDTEKLIHTATRNLTRFNLDKIVSQYEKVIEENISVGKERRKNA